MANLRQAVKSGHWPTLFAAFLYFDFCFSVWVLNGAMGPFLTQSFNLSPSQTGLMVSIPTLAGALMRFPLGVLSQYIGRKNAALVEMILIIVAMLYGWLFVTSFNDVLAMGVLLGIAGASFGVALSLGAGWYSVEHKGLAMGIAGAGNAGTVVALLLAPPVAQAYGWHAVYAWSAVVMLIPLIVMITMAKEPPDTMHQSLREHLSCLWERDGWSFNLIYIITFGGFIGLSTFLPSFFFSEFHVTKVEAGWLTMLAAIMGSGIRAVGGLAADRVGGIAALCVVLIAAVGCFLALSTQPSLVVSTVLFMICFAALGAGNGALFQLVPLRWPGNTAVAASMIGEIGALGGAILPNVMGFSKQWTGSFATGFISYAALSGFVLIGLTLWQRRWTRSWVGPWGRVAQPDYTPSLVAR
ncbi:MFS transporter [Rhodopila sp.]|uniref:MFS transporter n=1 Tax=Rhodopila sp. TaxID=2480087 RepID=UPI003D0D07E0